MHSDPVAADHIPTAAAHALHQPFVPAEQSPAELTFRALLLGSVLGVIFAASSVYLAVKVGMTVSASIPIAVLSIAVFKALGKGSILENTIVQTTGSAGESLAFGVAAALPALLLLGYDIDLIHAFMTAALGGILGVLMMIPLRHGLIVQEHGKLMYPEGTACADVLVVGEKGGTDAKTVIVGFVVGALYKFLYDGLKLWRDSLDVLLSWKSTIAGKTVVKGYTGGSIGLEVSPELLGVGYIIGPKIAGITFAGGVLSYLILIPMIQFFGSGLQSPLVSPDGTLIRDMEPGQIRNHYVLYIGAGAVATGGLISLLRSLPTILKAFKRGLDTFLASRRGAQAPQLLRTEQDLPITVVVVGSVLLVLAMWLLPPLQLNFLGALLILLFGFFFVTVSARITGEIGSSSNPISGMVVATLLFTCLVFLLLGWTEPKHRFIALTTAAIVGIAASNGGTTAQDLKTAYLVGGTPKKQQLALFVGVLTSAIFIGGTLVVLNQVATFVIPEEHPGKVLTEVTSQTMQQTGARLPLSAPVTETRFAEIGSALWDRGVEVSRDGDSALVLRTFKEVDFVELGANPALQGLAALTPLPPVSYRVGYSRGDPELLSGKYLVDDGGAIRFVVDPGIGGRITKFQGRDLERYEAPKARLFSLIIDGILTQKLPWDLVLLGVFIALMLELCGVSALPFAVGVYLPISTSAPIFVGGMVRYVVDKLTRAKDAEAEFSPGVLLSSGYIAGGAIAGVLVAMIALPNGGAWRDAINLPKQLEATGVGSLITSIGAHKNAHPLWSNLWGLLFFAAITLLLLATAIRRPKPTP